MDAMLRSHLNQENLIHWKDGKMQLLPQSYLTDNSWPDRESCLPPEIVPMPLHSCPLEGHIFQIYQK